MKLEVWKGHEKEQGRGSKVCGDEASTCSCMKTLSDGLQWFKWASQVFCLRFVVCMFARLSDSVLVSSSLKKKLTKPGPRQRIGRFVVLFLSYRPFSTDAHLVSVSY